MTKKFKLGDKFGFLTIKELFSSKRSSGGIKRMALCVCDCGNEHTAEIYNLSSGNTKWCDTCSSKFKSKHRKKHGHSDPSKKGTVEYKSYYTWRAMKNRCLNKNDLRYSDYGGRGIELCDRWSSYLSFLRDMGLPPTVDHQIDRIDNNGGYNKLNCRWVTRKQNSRNKRNNRFISYRGERKTLVEWSEITGLKRETISMRLKRGWSVESALEKGV